MCLADKLQHGPGSHVHGQLWGILLTFHGLCDRYAGRLRGGLGDWTVVIHHGIGRGLGKILDEPLELILGRFGKFDAQAGPDLGHGDTLGTQMVGDEEDQVF